MTSDKSALFLHYWNVLVPAAPKPVPEYRFGAILAGGTGKGVRNRLKMSGLQDWRFDWAWPDEKICVEVNGNAWRTKGGGRHGKDDDLRKWNAATTHGWRMFQFSPKMLKDHPGACIEMVYRALTTE